MFPLDKSLRNTFERKIKEAREIAEEASQAVLEQLGVGEATPFNHLTDDERNLRRRLRAHGRQLGDKRDSQNQTQEIERLVEEVAYEHWHRMLFARFLAENHLLMYPDPDEPIAITLEECEDLAAEEGARNGWELAARYAEIMLPHIFRFDSPVFELQFPTEYQLKLEKILTDMPVELFVASDSLGWVYQFWQSKKKDRINESEIKIGERELPAVTQLFTEPYMVNYLLDNSIGAWWASRRLTDEDLKNARSEEELREKASLQNLPLSYLRFERNLEGHWSLAAGDYEKWPNHLSELKVLDPCCGSGHFLVGVLLMLVPMRMEIEGLSAREAVDVVIRDNIHGLDIDRRVVEIAAFSIALTAWRYPNAGGYRSLQEINVASIGISLSAKKKDWIALANGNKRLENALDNLYDLLDDSTLFGSLINLDENGILYDAVWKEVKPLIGKLIDVKTSDEKYELSVTAQGAYRAAQMLSRKYDLVITNVPYRKRGSLNKKIQDFGEEKYPDSKDELATMFLERCINFSSPNGISCLVMPQFWVFHRRSLALRKKLLVSCKLNHLAILGKSAFETISGEVVNIGLFILSNSVPKDESLITGIDVTEYSSPQEKSTALRNKIILTVNQMKQLDNPNSRIVLEELNTSNLLEKEAFTAGGMSTYDKPRFMKNFWEQKKIDKDRWEYLQSTISRSTLYGGRESIVLWEKGEGQLYSYVQALSEQGYNSGIWRAGVQVWGKKGILFKLMGERLESTLYTGQAFDNNTGVLIPYDENILPALWEYCSDPLYSKEIRKIDKKVKVTNGTLNKVSFDVEHWKEIASAKYPDGLPKPYSEDPTQWIFHGHPAKSDAPLQVAVARLLGYRWPVEYDTSLELSEESLKLIEKCKELISHSDSDGIVCIPPVLGEVSAAEKLLNLLAEAYGNQWSTEVLSQLLIKEEHAGKSLESWLRDKFFKQHCKLFKQNPFIWHIWDGLRDGFSVLVNYHMLNKKMLETLIYTYLGDWIKRQKDDIPLGVDGAKEKLAAAESLKKRLELILEGEAPYDIFVRWKPLDKQPIGWEPDIDDGVRINIRPFMLVPDIGKKGAGILRDKPNIKWGKDRGKDVESAPWYHAFNGDRINDYHLSLSDKSEARRKRKEDS